MSVNKLNHAELYDARNNIVSVYHRAVKARNTVMANRLTRVEAELLLSMKEYGEAPERETTKVPA